MRWTALHRSGYEYHQGEDGPFPDVEHAAPQNSGLCVEPRRPRRTVRPFVPQSELQSGLVDVAAPPRKTVFSHEPNKRHAPSSALRSDRRPNIRRFLVTKRRVPFDLGNYSAEERGHSRKMRWLSFQCATTPDWRF